MVNCVLFVIYKTQVYVSMGGQTLPDPLTSLLKFIHLLHLNQAVLGSRMRLMAGQDRAGLIDTYMDT